MIIGNKNGVNYTNRDKTMSTLVKHMQLSKESFGKT